LCFRITVSINHNGDAPGLAGKNSQLPTANKLITERKAIVNTVDISVTSPFAMSSKQQQIIPATRTQVIISVRSSQAALTEGDVEIVVCASDFVLRQSNSNLRKKSERTANDTNLASVCGGQ
jgi:hypothetical protein